MPDLETLFKTFYASLTVFSNKYVQDMEAAKEIVQDVFLHLHEKRDSLQINSSPKSYLFQAVRNRSLNHIQKIKTRQGHYDQFQLTVEPASFDDQLEAVELEEKLSLLIQELPEACQRIFIMSRFDGKKNQEIADELGISKRTVETQISNALKALRNRLLADTELSASRKSFLLSVLL